MAFTVVQVCALRLLGVVEKSCVRLWARRVTQLCRMACLCVPEGTLCARSRAWGIQWHLHWWVGTSRLSADGSAAWAEKLGRKGLLCKTEAGRAVVSRPKAKVSREDIYPRCACKG